MSPFYNTIAFTVVLAVLGRAASLECYKCSDVMNMNECYNKVACEDNQVCYKKSKNEYTEHVSYDLGCTDNQNCGGFANLSTELSAVKMDGGQTHACFECCSTERCNINLCEYKYSSECVDDVKTDCAYLNSLFSICKLINKARKLCPKYCKLCEVDGSWSPWSNWSDCDVTCGNGTQVRTRACTDPAPQYGGLDCLGNDTDTKSCQNKPCPGKWTVL
ncbi:thrombospondin-1-like isoform X2 [Mercenaria mercenaria]|uniref:thrombospondin-1-like isoform X2 n=1 Tax=Mercenaria mercenaria TaxID=6596 RepID=UPI00234F3520|nr:thrombospondin-1-like isoform X2 [Mercenaria mercenaria]